MRHTPAIVVDDSDQSYAIVEHKSVIVVDDSGRCVIAEEEGERGRNPHVMLITRLNGAGFLYMPP